MTIPVIENGDISVLKENYKNENTNIENEIDNILNQPLDS